MGILLPMLKNGRIISAIISALGAFISAFCAGCKLTVGEVSVKEFEARIFSTSTNDVMEVANEN